MKNLSIRCGKRIIAVSIVTQDLYEYGHIAGSVLHSCVCTDAAFLPTLYLIFYETGINSAFGKQGAKENGQNVIFMFVFQVE